MDLNLAGKVAIVTGGGQACGKAYCLALAEEGVRVVVADINAETARQTAKEIQDKGGKALAVKVDVAKWEEVSHMAEKAIEAFGQIDILVNNAGIRGMSPIEDMPEELWDRDIDVNLRGVFYCTKAVARHMKERRYGKIINQSSKAGVEGHPAGGSAYAAAKAGVLGFSRSMARELGRFNIVVNAIAPTVIRTPFMASLPKKVVEDMENTTPLGRLAEVEDFTGLVLFLASDRSGYITGQTFIVDGGSRPT